MKRYEKVRECQPVVTQKRCRTKRRQTHKMSTVLARFCRGAIKHKKACQQYLPAFYSTSTSNQADELMINYHLDGKIKKWLSLSGLCTQPNSYLYQ